MRQDSPIERSAAVVERSPRVIRRTWSYIALLSCLAIALTAVVWRVSGPPVRPEGIAVLAALTAVTVRGPRNWVRAPIALSLNGTLLVTAVPIIGPAGAVIIGVLGGLLGIGGAPPRAVVFNTAMRAVMTTSGGLVYIGVLSLMGQSPHHQTPPLSVVAVGLLVVDLLQCVVNAGLLAGVVTLWEQTSFNGQLAALLTATGLEYVGHGVLALLFYVLWIPCNLGVASLIFGIPLVWASRWALAQYGHQVRARRNTLSALITAIEVRSADAAAHTNDVARLSEVLAEEMAMTADEVDAARAAATIHGLDLLAVGSARGTVHAGEGRIPTQALEQVSVLAEALPALDHRRTGPEGRRAVPRVASILEVADAFILSRDGDETQSGKGVDGALTEVRSRPGFDPAVVEALGRLLRRSRR